MNIKKMQELAESYHYWDMRVCKLDCNHFADEVTLTYNDDDGEVTYSFLGCYKALFNHVANYEKTTPAKEMKLSQIPYFLQDISFAAEIEDGVDFFSCKIKMFPLEVEIWFKHLEISKG